MRAVARACVVAFFERARVYSGSTYPGRQHVLSSEHAQLRERPLCLRVLWKAFKTPSKIAGNQASPSSLSLRPVGGLSKSRTEPGSSPRGRAPWEPLDGHLAPKNPGPLFRPPDLSSLCSLGSLDGSAANHQDQELECKAAETKVN